MFTCLRAEWCPWIWAAAAFDWCWWHLRIGCWAACFAAGQRDNLICTLGSFWFYNLDLFFWEHYNIHWWLGNLIDWVSSSFILYMLRLFKSSWCSPFQRWTSKPLRIWPATRLVWFLSRPMTWNSYSDFFGARTCSLPGLQSWSPDQTSTRSSLSHSPAISYSRCFQNALIDDWITHLFGS